MLNINAQRIAVNYTVNAVLRNEKAYGKNGELINFNVPIARAGIFKYYGIELGMTGEQAYRKLTVYRPLSAFTPEFLKTAIDTPISDDHPSQDVSPDNYTEVNVGWTGSKAFMDGEDMLVDKVIVYDEASIKSIEDGTKNQLSIGFNAIYDFSKPGVSPDGTPYDGIETPIKINHVAIVKLGKAGDIYALNSEGIVMSKVVNADEGKKPEDEMKNSKNEGGSEGDEKEDKKAENSVLNAVLDLGSKLDNLAGALATVVGHIAKNSDIEDIDTTKTDKINNDTDTKDCKNEASDKDADDKESVDNSAEGDDEDGEEKKSTNKKSRNSAETQTGLDKLMNSANALQRPQITNSSKVIGIERALSILDNA